jgi:hypothetical protein
VTVAAVTATAVVRVEAAVTATGAPEAIVAGIATIAPAATAMPMMTGARLRIISRRSSRTTEG